jgi:hypothetical protein
VLVSLFVSAGRVDDEEGGEWEVEEVSVDDVLDRLLRSLRLARGTQFTCFAGTKVLILTTLSNSCLTGCCVFTTSVSFRFHRAQRSRCWRLSKGEGKDVAQLSVQRNC